MFEELFDFFINLLFRSKIARRIFLVFLVAASVGIFLLFRSCKKILDGPKAPAIERVAGAKSEQEKTLDEPKDPAIGMIAGAKAELEKTLERLGTSGEEVLEQLAKHPLRSTARVPEWLVFAEHKRHRILALPPEVEARLSQKLVDEEEANGGFYSEEEAVNRVSNIVQRIVAVLPEEIPVHIRLTKDDTLNACCLPDGTVFVHRGTLRQISDDELLAAILAHEYGHAVAHHGNESLSRVLKWAPVKGGVKGEAEEWAQEWKIEGKPAQGAIVKGLFGIGIHVGLNAGVHLPRSRRAELEADRLGMLYMSRAGFDPEAMIRLMELFEEKSGKEPAWAAYLSTHPSHQDRIENARKALPIVQADKLMGGAADALRKNRKYREFLKSSAPRFPIPLLDEGFVPQGLAMDTDRNRLWMSAYTTNGPSVLVEMNPDDGTVQGRHSLVNPDGTPHTGHVGGIAVTPQGLFLAASGEGVVHISPETLAAAGVRDEVRVSAPLPTHGLRASFCTFDGTLLWVGTFYEKKKFDTPKNQHRKGNNALCIGYEIAEKDGEPSLIPQKAYSLPDKIQGMAFAPNGCLVVSQSYGTDNSNLFVFRPEFDGKERLAYQNLGIPVCDLKQGHFRKGRLERVEMPPRAEGISFQDDSLFLLFESGAQLYREKDSDKGVPMGTIWGIGLDEFRSEDAPDTK